MSQPAASPPKKPPRQDRSRRTLERIVRASLELLEEGGADALTVAAVVQRARSSVGSFYARFDGKDDLLDYLGERVWREAKERWERALASREWGGLDLTAVVEGGATLLVDAQAHRASYAEALDRAAGARRGAFDAFRAHVLDGVGELLLERRDEITHEAPEVAVRVGLAAVVGVIDAEARAAAGSGLGRETVIAESRRLLLAYLVGQAPAPGAEAVDFFDVWG